MIPQRRPRRRPNQSQHPQLSSRLQKQCQLETSSHPSELMTWTRRQLEQEAPRKSGRPPSVVITSATNLIRLQGDLKEHDKGEYEFRNTQNGTRIITKEMTDYSAMKSCLNINFFQYFTCQSSNPPPFPRHASRRYFQQP